MSLLNIDIDFVEPTLVCRNFMNVFLGGNITSDNYAGRGSSGKYLHGDTTAIDEFFKNKNVVIKKFSFSPRPSFIIKNELF